jgi:predicted amidohydrolase
MGESIEAWRHKACVAIDGPQYAAVGAIAQRHRIYLCLNAYETDPHFPALYFQASVIFGPTGDPVLRYRRLISMFAPTPHDVWDAYLDRYGYEGVFPVARTEIGALACIASEEILYPEVARCLAVRGAEVFLHSTSEVYGPGQSPKEVAKRARAIENLAYVVSANSAGMTGTAIPEQSVDGGSKLIDHRGLVLVDAGPGETMSAFGAVDLAALRAERRRPGMGNVLARQRFELFAPTYASHAIYPANSIGSAPLDRAHFVDTQRRTIDALIARGVIA